MLQIGTNPRRCVVDQDVVVVDVDGYHDQKNVCDWFDSFIISFPQVTVSATHELLVIIGCEYFNDDNVVSQAGVCVCAH